MMFVRSVQSRTRRRKGRVAYPPARQATVRVVVGDSFGTFVREAVMSKPWRITLVSPWLGGTELERGALDRLLRHARRSSASVFVITREPVSESHATALAAIADVPRATISYNPRVHAKLFISQEGRGRGLAVIGSGNATDSSTTLDEAGLLIRPLRGSAVIRQLALSTVHQLTGRTAIRVHRAH
jgi:hypothetical protein